MTDEGDRFERVLSDRLSAAESRVSAPAEPPDAMYRARWPLASVAAAAVPIALLAGILLIVRAPGGPAGDSPSPSASEVLSVQAREGDFTLTVSVPRTRWAVGETVPVTSTLAYIGDDQVTLFAGGASAIFEVRQISGGSGVRFDAQHWPCVPVSISKEQPAVREFNIPDWGQAILTPGRWQITATSEFTIETCSREMTDSLSASLMIDVSSEMSPIASPSVSSPSPTSPPQSEAPAALTRVASFGSEGSLEQVLDMTAWDRGLLAVGTRYAAESMPNFGPRPPHEGRIWLSPDGMNWADVTPDAAFVDRELRFVVPLDDGSILALGENWNQNFDQVTNYAWRSVDGITWSAVDLSGLPKDEYIQQLARGPKGIVAATGTMRDFEPSLWHSVDGTHWTMTHEPRGKYPEQSSSLADLRAGPEGFVALLGTVTYGGESAERRSYVLASRDGTSWIEAEAPESALRLAAVGNDWLIAAEHVGSADSPAVTVVLWSSANGLTWQQSGSFKLGLGSIDEAQCFEYPDTLVSISSVVLLGSLLSYPCSEGAFVTPSAVRAAHRPGLNDWSALSLADQTALAAVIDTGDAAVLAVNVERLSTRAEFWILPDR